MGRSYLSSRGNISTGQITLFCSHGAMFSRLPGKVSHGDVDFVKCKQKVFPLSGKVVFIWDKNYLGHRDLACHQARFRLTGKLFVSYERKVTFHTIFVEISLVNLSKCFSLTGKTSSHMNRPSIIYTPQKHFLLQGNGDHWSAHVAFESMAIASMKHAVVWLTCTVGVATYNAYGEYLMFINLA